MPVFFGIATGGIFKLVMSGFSAFKDTIMWSFPSLNMAGFGYEISPLFVGVGYLVGLRIAAVMFAGGIFGYWVIIPLIHAFGGHNIISPGTVPIDTMVTDDLRENYLRYIGAGGVAFGGLISVFRSLPDILSSFKHALKAFGADRAHVKLNASSEKAPAQDPEHQHILFGGALLGFLAGGFAYEYTSAMSLPAMIVTFLGCGLIGGLVGGWLFGLVSRKSAEISGRAKRTERDMPFSLVGYGIALTFLFLWLYPPFHLGFLESVIILVISMFFVAVSARMVGLIGTTNQPVSGMTITALLALTIIFMAIGHPSQTIKIASITAGAVVCIAISLSGDLSQDLKSAALIGATPWKVQLAQIMGTVASAVRSGFVLLILYAAYGIGPATAAHPNALPAPQAQLMANLVEGATGGHLPWLLLLLGAGVGLVCELCGISALAFAIGLYLPITNWPMVLVGGIIAWYVAKKKKEEALSEDDPGSLYCSGLIAGDALMGIAIAGIMVISSRMHWAADKFALRHPGDGLNEDMLSTALYGLVAASVYYFAMRKKTTSLTK